MNIFGKISALLRQTESNEDDTQFLKAIEAYRKAFEQTEPLTKRAIDATEYSAFVLDQKELSRHQNAIRELNNCFNFLRNAFSVLSQNNEPYESSSRLYLSACQLHHKAITAYAMSVALTNLVASKRQLELKSKKHIASRESPEAERAVDQEIHALDSLSMAAEELQKEADQFEKQVEFSISFTKLTQKPGG